MRTVRLLACLLVAACGPSSVEPAGGSDDDDDDVPPEEMPDAAEAPPDAPDPPPTGASPGGPCTCDADCPAVAGHEGICVLGVCMTRASAACSAAGSQPECAPGSRCWGLSGREGSICWPDCAGISCAGTCDSDGSCAPRDGMDCDRACASYC